MVDGKITLDPKTTPGFIHAKNLTVESADAATRALLSNRVNHIFTSDKAIVVRMIPICSHGLTNLLTQTP
jgi:hypothetical protein